MASISFLSVHEIFFQIPFYIDTTHTYEANPLGNPYIHMGKFNTKIYLLTGILAFTSACSLSLSANEAPSTAKIKHQLADLTEDYTSLSKDVG